MQKFNFLHFLFNFYTIIKKLKLINKIKNKKNRV